MEQKFVQQLVHQIILTYQLLVNVQINVKMKTIKWLVQEVLYV